MGTKKKSLPFDREGGVIVIPRRLIESNDFQGLSAQSKALILLMQLHWKNDKPVDYSVQEAMDKIPCSKPTARAAFNQLMELGFIQKVDESIFNSRTQSKSRTWRLTWLPFMWRPPTNEWKKIGNQPDQKCTL